MSITDKKKFFFIEIFAIMLKTNLTILTAFIMLISFTRTSAQTIIWGTGHPNPTIDSIGEFASVDTTLAGAGWNATLIRFGNWVWSNTGIGRGSFSAPAGVHINSPTLSNGVAMFDSDFFYTQNPANFPQEAKLTSPAINLTGYADSLVLLKFYAGLRDFASDSNIVRFSINGGTSWVSFDVITALGHQSNGTPSEGFVSFNVSPLLAGATNLTDCRIEFYFNGDSYFWSVDDVSLETFVPSFDLGIENGTLPQIVTLGSAEMPLDFVNDVETNWGANVKNTGFIGLTNGGAMLHMEVAKDNAGTWVTEATDSISLPAIAVGANYFAYKTTIGSANWLPTTEGLYRVTYTIRTALSQTTITNDSLVDYFGVNNNIYLSKVPLATDNYPFADNATLPAVDNNNLPTEHEFGSLYYIPAGVTDTFAITQVKYRGATANIIPGSTSSEITARIYKFGDSNGDGFWTQQVSGIDPELQLLGVGLDTFALAATTTYRPGEMSILDINTFNNGVELQADSFYLVTLLQSNNLGLRNAQNQTRAAYIGYVEYYYETTIDSMPNYYIPAAVFRDVHTTSGGTTVDNTWYTGYSNANAPVPSIGLVLEKRATTVTSTPNLGSNAYSMEMFPNPTSNQLTVKVSMDEPFASVQYVVTDATGRVVIMHTNKNVQNDTMTFDVSFLPSGLYYTTVRTPKGATTQKFVKK
jgi:hypothetical protein